MIFIIVGVKGLEPSTPPDVKSGCFSPSQGLVSLWLKLHAISRLLFFYQIHFYKITLFFLHLAHKRILRNTIIQMDHFGVSICLILGYVLPILR